MSNDKAALRAERQDRLAKKAGAPATAQSSQPTNVASDNTAPVVESAPAAPAAVAPAAETFTAAVLDPRSVTKTADVSLHLFNEKSSDPHWLVCADGQPVAQIRLSDQEDADRLTKVFVTEAYAHGIVEAASRMDLSEILAGVRARPYVAAVRGSDAFQAIESQLKAASTDELRRAKANLRNDMINTLNLVVTAQTKNYIVQNSLKDGLFNLMRAAGIEQDRAVAIIEGAWQEKAAEYFEEAFKQASKWMDLTPEAYQDIQETIHGMPQRTPMVEASVAPAPSASKNVPLMTYTAGAHDEVDSKEELRRVFGFRSRHMAGKTSR
jgi:uncharacterized protein YukE